MTGRRELLGATAAGVAAGLAGCADVGDEQGSAARFGRGATAPAEPEVVALADSTGGGRPTGRIESSSATFERANGRLVLVSYHRVVAGDAAFSSGWRYVDVRADHDWREVDGEVVAAATNTTTIPVDSPDAAFRLVASSEPGRRTWRVALPEPDTRAVAYRFRTEFEPAGDLAAGTELARVVGGTKLTEGGLLGGNELVETEQSLVYGDTDA